MNKSDVIAAARGQIKWLNYSTWFVLRWLERDIASRDRCRKAARQMKALATDSRYFWDWNMDSNDAAACELADWLDAAFVSRRPDIGPTIYAELLGGALAEVDWLSIAYGLLEELEEKPASPSEPESSGQSASASHESKGEAT